MFPVFPFYWLVETISRFAAPVVKPTQMYVLLVPLVASIVVVLTPPQIKAAQSTSVKFVNKNSKALIISVSEKPDADFRTTILLYLVLLLK